jgi:hypothetical protein
MINSETRNRGNLQEIGEETGWDAMRLNFAKMGYWGKTHYLDTKLFPILSKAMFMKKRLDYKSFRTFIIGENIEYWVFAQ